MRALVPLIAILAAGPILAQPTALVNDVTVEEVAVFPGGVIRLAEHAPTGTLFVLVYSGAVLRFDPPYTGGGQEVVAPSGSGLTLPQGLAVDADGTLYMTGSVTDGPLVSAQIRKGTPDGSGYIWSTVARTEFFAGTGNGYYHRLNAILPTPDGTSLIVAHGSRTDHGEVQDFDGAAPGLREVPVTSALLRVPIDADDVVLPNDAAALAAGGYLLADGFRNAFDLAYDADGRLYAAENAGDRDDPDELNWVREGHHYGFPWRIGTNDTPQRFPGYDPAADPLLNPILVDGESSPFSNDPDYPAPPAGITFTDPVLNVGPDADRYRALDRTVRDASDDGVSVGTFTPHRSPLGLTFDTAGELPSPFTRSGFVLSWTGDDSPLLAPFGDPSEDLVQLSFLDPETVSARRVVGGFTNPIDMIQQGRTLLVTEFSEEARLWAVRFTGAVAAEPGTERLRALRVSPSPFRTTATVSLALDAPTTVRVEVFDVLGRPVARLHDGPLAAGAHTFVVNGRTLPPGHYTVRVVHGDETMSRPVVRVR